MSRSRDSRFRRCSRRQARARLRQLVWARVGPLAQREPLLNAYYQTAPTIHHLAYNYLIHAEQAHRSDDKCLRERGHPGLPPWPEHLACLVFADDNAAICAITTALAVRHFAQRILADFIREDENRRWTQLQRADRLIHALAPMDMTEQLRRRCGVDEDQPKHEQPPRPDQSLLVGPKL